MARKEFKQQEISEPAQEQPKVDFDAWWAVVNKKMPTNHPKEVVLADFKARGISQKETMSVYSEALAKYGIKLK